ncbi:MAG: hypothetical protein K2N58_05055 [Treponemataceae bacterium]|nr:hypothetical protein [Treponemataceae bacterium]
MKKISSSKNGKHIFPSVFIFCLSVSICACSLYSNMEVPEKVSIKSDAKFSVAIGEKSVDMNDIFGDSLIESISDTGDDNKLEVFKYVPDKNDNTMKYLLHSNIYNFDLDIGEMLGDLKMDDMLNGEKGINADEKIQVPAINSPEPIEFEKLNEILSPNVNTPKEINTQWEIKTLIEFGKVDYIKTAVIKKDATIEIKVAKPAGTEDVTLTLNELKISGAGLNFNQDDFKPVTDGNYLLFQRLDFAKLEDETRRTLDFSKGDIKIDGKIDVTIAKGAKCSGLKTQIDVNMKEIEKALADFSDLVNFKTAKNKLPKNLLKSVEKVYFGKKSGDSYYKREQKGENEAEDKLSNVKSEGLGIKCQIVNSLPVGNKIDISITSKTLGINDNNLKDREILSYGDENLRTKNWCVFDDLDFSKFNPEDPPSMDFEIKLSDEQKLYNLEFGKEYSFSIKDSEFVFDWDIADVKLDALSSGDPIKGENDLSSFSKETLFGDLDGEFGEFIRNNIEFGDGIKAYFYAQKPAGGLDIGDIKLGGTVDMTYTLDGKAEKDSILEQGFELSSPMKWKPNEQNEFTTDLEKNKQYIGEYDMSRILQSGVKEPKLEYNLTISGGKESGEAKATPIYKLDLDNLDENSSTSISIDAAIVFPLELKIKKGATLDILKAADFDEDKKDLFGRDEGKKEDYAKYLDYISFKYNLKNNVIDGFDFKIEIDDRHVGSEEYSGIHETFDKDEMKFKTAHAEKILEKLFKPKIYLKFDEEKDTDIKILRSGLAGENSFSFSPVVTIKLNGDSPICINDILD